MLDVKMGRTFLCVLGLFLLNTLQSGHAEEDAAILEIPEVTLFEGDFVTLCCRHHHKTKAIFLKDGSPLEINADHESLRPEKNTAEMTIIRVSGGGNYKCKFDDGTESESRELKVEARRREVTLTADRMVIPLGGIAKLSCSVENPDGFKYEWFRQTSDFSGKTSVHIEHSHELDITHGGKYTCRGRRSEPDVFTPQSDSVTVEETVPYRVILTLQSNWAQIFSGETITLRCEIEHGGDTEWTYEWKTTSSEKPSNQNELKITSADVSHSGDYRCLGRMKSEQQSLTDWSDPITLTVSDKPQPVLTVSPSWLSPGDSVTLDCELQHPSAGWRFYWYKTVPKLSDSYSYELLPDSSRGTEQDSYIIHGQTHTAGYVCRAGRGDPEYYTDYSEQKFVWSGDFHSSASLTVSPDRVQHFITGSVSLNCGGISADWRVRKFIQNSYYSSCSWRTMTGSTCKIKSNKPHDAVYWCESGSGEFSNAVNITMRKSIILVSPVHPVTEGDSVILSCRLRRQNIVSNVVFYRNGELIQNDTRKVLNISAVSKSDEGFYKCRHWIPWSTQSWMSVRAASIIAVSKPESSSSLPLRMIVGLVCGIVLIILLLLLCHYRPSKDLCFNRPIQSESTDQVSYINDDINQNDPLYSTLLHSDVGLYELINHPEEAANGTSNEAEQSAEYSNVTMGSAADQ